MSKQKKIILIIATAVVLIALFFVLLYANKRESENEITGSDVGEFGIVGEEKNLKNLEVQKLEAEAKRKEVSPEIIEEENIKNFAKIFVERWGSWSSDSDFYNFESLKSMATEDMENEIEKE
ncbi:MAG: hypothetical protein V1891_02620, partial [bacterium]